MEAGPRTMSRPQCKIRMFLESCILSFFTANLRRNFVPLSNRTGFAAVRALQVLEFSFFTLLLL